MIAKRRSTVFNTLKLLLFLALVAVFFHHQYFLDHRDQTDLNGTLSHEKFQHKSENRDVTALSDDGSWSVTSEEDAKFMFLRDHRDPDRRPVSKNAQEITQAIQRNIDDIANCNLRYATHEQMEVWFYRYNYACTREKCISIYVSVTVMG